MKITYKDFEEFLQGKFVEDYHGVKDDAEDEFDRWMSCLDIQEVIDYADEYAAVVKAQD